jgi:hypothetical protein
MASQRTHKPVMFAATAATAPQITWQGGIAMITGGAYVPAASMSLGHLLTWCGVTAPSRHLSPWPCVAYQLKGVPAHEAVCVEEQNQGAMAQGLWTLYMPPSRASLAWHYLLNWLNIQPSIHNCPVAVFTTPPTPRYVAISNYGADGSWGASPACPDLSKLTRL